MRPVRAAVAALVAAAAVTTFSPSASLAARDSWVVPIDSRDTIQWLAETAGTAFAQQHNRLVGIDTATGAVLWRSQRKVVGAPVAADGTAFVSFGHGELGAFEGRTGRLLWTRRLAKPAVSFEPSLVASRSYVVAMTSLGSGSRRLSAYAARGVLVWEREIPGIAPAHATLLPNADVIAILEREYERAQNSATFVRGDTGALLARVSNATEIVGFTPSSVDLRLRYAGDSEAHVVRVDLRTGAVSNALAILDQGAPRFAEADTLASGDGYVVRRLSVLGHPSVQVIARSGGASRAIPGIFAGGPVLAHIFLERNDGLYTVDLQHGDKARRIVGYRRSATEASLTLDRHVLYVGLANERRILTVDLERSTVVVDRSVDCDFFEGIAVRGQATLVHCDPPARKGGPASTLIGFPRYDTALART